MAKEKYNNQELNNENLEFGGSGNKGESIINNDEGSQRIEAIGKIKSLNMITQESGELKIEFTMDIKNRYEDIDKNEVILVKKINSSSKNNFKGYSKKHKLIFQLQGQMNRVIEMSYLNSSKVQVQAKKDPKKDKELDKELEKKHYFIVDSIEVLS